MEERKVIDGKYQLQKKIAKGSFGEVYLAHYKHLPYAIKFIKKENTKFFHFLQHYIKEQANIQKSLTHINILKLHQFIDSQNQYIFVLQYCEKETLRHRIKTQPYLTYQDILEMLRQVMLGIQRIHLAGFTHRDIKLDNILLTEVDGQIVYKISDFGFATRKKNQQTILGTSQYMAPEIIRETDYDSKVDVWAIGVLLYFSLYIKKPFQNITDICKQTNPKYSLKKNLDDMKGAVWNEALEQFFKSVFVEKKEERISLNELFKTKLIQQATNNYNEKMMKKLRIDTQMDPDSKADCLSFLNYLYRHQMVLQLLKGMEKLAGDTKVKLVFQCHKAFLIMGHNLHVSLNSRKQPKMNRQIKNWPVVLLACKKEVDYFMQAYLEVKSLHQQKSSDAWQKQQKQGFSSIKEQYRKSILEMRKIIAKEDYMSELRMYLIFVINWFVEGDSKILKFFPLKVDEFIREEFDGLMRRMTEKSARQMIEAIQREFKK